MDDVDAELAEAVAALGCILTGVVSRGPSGVLWRARGSGGGVMVAEVPVAGADGAVPGPPPVAEHRLLERLDALAVLRDPRLCAVLGAAPAGRHRLAVAVEEVHGPTLGELVDACGPLTAGEAVSVLVPIADALATLHAAGIVHGDVAPANVVLAQGQRPVLVDLLTGWLPQEQGTAGFAAPERGHGAAEAPCDVYSLAMMARWMTGDGAEEPWDAVLATAVDPDPGRRPGAAELAGLIAGVARPDPPPVVDLARLAGARLGAAIRQPTLRSTPAGGRARARTGPERPVGGAGAVGGAGPAGGVGLRRGTGPVGGAGPMSGLRPVRPPGRVGPARWRGPAAVCAVATVLVAAAVTAAVRTGQSGGDPASGTSTFAASPACAASGGASAPQDAAVPGGAATSRGAAVPRGAATGGAAACPADPVLRRHDPAAAAAALTERRPAVLSAGGDLGAVVLPGSAAERGDRALVAAMAAEGVAVAGASAAVQRAELLDAGPALVPRGPLWARVLVIYRLGPYRVVGADGAAVVVAGDRRAATLVLRWSDRGWRVSDVAGAAPVGEAVAAFGAAPVSDPTGQPSR